MFGFAALTDTYILDNFVFLDICVDITQSEGKGHGEGFVQS